MTPDQAITFCGLFGVDRQNYLDSQKQIYCDAHWRDDPDHCYEWTEEYQTWVDSLRPLPGSETIEVDAETAARLQEAWDLREQAREAEREQLRSDVLGVLNEVYSLLQSIQGEGIPDMNERRARLQAAGIIVDLTPNLAEATLEGVDRWRITGILQRTEAIKDWLSLRRSTQYDYYSLSARYAQLASCVFESGACATEKANIEALDLQYPRFEAFFSRWTPALSSIPTLSLPGKTVISMPGSLKL